MDLSEVASNEGPQGVKATLLSRATWEATPLRHPSKPTTGTGTQTPPTTTRVLFTGPLDRPALKIGVMKRVRKQNLSTKPCGVCGLPFTWRKKWERDWQNVRDCSERCRCRRETPRRCGLPLAGA